MKEYLINVTDDKIIMPDYDINTTDVIEIHNQLLDLKLDKGRYKITCIGNTIMMFEEINKLN